MRIEEYPLMSFLESIAIQELDRQYLNDEIAPASSEEGGYFNAVDGELIGIPDWHSLVAAVYTALKDEGFL